jgi:hypothetical protein
MEPYSPTRAAVNMSVYILPNLVCVYYKNGIIMQHCVHSKKKGSCEYLPR